MREKIGLIGINGTGKSTLLKIVAGLEEPDDGGVVRGRNLDIRFLSQNPKFHDGDTILESIVRENEGTRSCVGLREPGEDDAHKAGLHGF